MENAIGGIIFVLLYFVFWRYMLSKAKKEEELMKKHNVYKSPDFIEGGGRFSKTEQYSLGKDGQRVYFDKDDNGEYVVKHSVNGVVFKEKAEFCGTAANKVYHRNNCEWAKKIAKRHIIRFDTPEEAEKFGFRACKVCIKSRSSMGNKSS